MRKDEEKAKWRRPESAPKDGTIIIGYFGYPWPHVAVWKRFQEEWEVVEVTVSDSEIVCGEEVHEFGFEITTFQANELLRWMPMPRGKL